MKIKNIYLKSKKPLDLKQFQRLIRSFLRYLSNTTKSQYISIQFGVRYSNEQTTKNNINNINIGIRYILNIESEDERKYYVEYISNNYVNNSIIKNDNNVVKSLYFNYIEVDESEYEKFLKNLITTFGNSDSVKPLEYDDIDNINSILNV